VRASSDTLNDTSGGRNDTLANDPIVMPNGWPSSERAVTTVTGEGTCRSTARSAAPLTFSVVSVAVFIGAPPIGFAGRWR